MDIDKARTVAHSLIDDLKPYIEKGDVVGSIRRGVSQVKDIDLVILPKYEFMILEHIKSILKKYGKLEGEGKKVLQIRGGEINIDCYLAKEKNYDVLIFIRTGSKEHNQRIATEALKQGKKLSYSDGLIDLKTKSVVARSEKEIYDSLGMKYLEPKERH